MMTSLSCSSVRCCTRRKFQLCFNVLRQYSSSKELEVKIQIPRRIQRGPTDILKALAATVSRDSTAPHYKYHDDPFLTPSSNIAKRSYAMAKESGRKAARWIQDQHSELFKYQESFPFIEEYAPKNVYDETTVVDETTLINVIHKAEVSNAIKVYELLEKQGIKISKDANQSFLELLCFFNCEDPLPEDLLEERWFHQSSKGREKLRKTWKDNSLAEKIFLSIEQKDSDAYSAIIQGMTRYCQVERAWQLYEETLEKSIVLHTEAYNSLMRVVHFLRENTELQWKLIQELLVDMAQKKVQPNTATFNSVLEVISTMGNQKLSKGYALQTLAEFRSLNIQPSLASYYFLLITFCKPRGPVSNILVEIMNTIRGKEFFIQDPKDTNFFVTAMDVCRNHLQDKNLAYQVDNLLHTGNNYTLIGDSYKESIYYRNYFLLMCLMEPVDTFMELYHKIVPHIYTPEPAVMEEVIKTISLNGAIEHLSKIWSDIILFDHIERDNVVSALLSCMVENQPPQESALILQFGNIVWELYSRQENVEDERYRKWRWTGQMLGDILIVLLRAELFQEACEVFNKLKNTPQTILGVPNVESLQLFLDSCINNKNEKTAIMCVEYCGDASFPEVEYMAQKLLKSFSLNPSSIAKLSNIIGKDLSTIQ